MRIIEFSTFRLLYPLFFDYIVEKNSKLVYLWKANVVPQNMRLYDEILKKKKHRSYILTVKIHVTTPNNTRYDNVI